MNFSVNLLLKVLLFLFACVGLFVVAKLLYFFYLLTFGGYDEPKLYDGDAAYQSRAYEELGGAASGLVP